MYVHIYVYMYVCVYIWRYKGGVSLPDADCRYQVGGSMYEFVYVCMFIYVYICMCVYIYGGIKEESLC